MSDLGIINRKIGESRGEVYTCCDRASWRVDIHGDVSLLVCRVQIEQLCNQEIGHVIVHCPTQAHNPLQEKMKFTTASVFSVTAKPIEDKRE